MIQTGMKERRRKNCQKKENEKEIKEKNEGKGDVWGIGTIYKIICNI
jgi:hypothetical protein